MILARRGTAFTAGDGDYTLDPAVRAHYDSLIAAIVSQGQSLRRVIHLWSLAPVDPANSSFEAAQVSGFYSLMFLAQALGAAGVSQPLDLHVVGSQLCSVIGGEQTAPERSTLLGLATVIPQEYRTCAASCIDLEPGALAGDPQAVDHVVSELLSGDSVPLVAYRGGQR